MNQSQADSDPKPKKKRTIRTYVKYAAGLLLLLVLGLMIVIVIRFRNDAQIPYTVSTEGITIPTYDEIEIDFSHHYDKSISIQATGGAAIDLDGGAEELFLCGGQGQGDAIFRYENGSFKNITTEVGYVKEGDEATMSVTSLDVDKDGDTDIVVPDRGKEICWYVNPGQDKVTGRWQRKTIHSHSEPMFMTVADVNGDGIKDFVIAGGVGPQ